MSPADMGGVRTRSDMGDARERAGSRGFRAEARGGSRARAIVWRSRIERVSRYMQSKGARRTESAAACGRKTKVEKGRGGGVAERKKAVQGVKKKRWKRHVRTCAATREGILAVAFETK